MAKDTIQLGEGFTAQVQKGGAVEPSATATRHYIIGWVFLAVLLVLALVFGAKAFAAGDTMGLGESFKASVKKAPKQGHIGGVLNVTVTRGGKVVQEKSYKNQIINVGETALRDCFGGTGTPTCTTVQNFKFHGLGTSATAITEPDTGCGTELTTQYNPDSTRATGTQTNNGLNVYRTVGTNTVDATVTVQEFCLMSQAATAGGTMWTRILTGGISLVSGDGVQTTYDLTIE